MDCAGFPEEDYAFYALGALAEAQAREVDEHLAAGCGVCREGVRKAREVWSSVAASTPPAEPSKGLRKRLLDLLD